MNRNLLFLPIFLLVVACSTKKKDLKQVKPDNTFIDSTDFKYFGLENFDIQDWYDGKVKLKSLTKAQAIKYYQYRLRNSSVDTDYYQFYSIQKNHNEQKIITIVDGATGNFPDLRMLIYDAMDSLIGFYPVAGIGKDPDLTLKYKVISNKINDTTYISTRLDEYVGEFDLGKVSRDSTITKFAIGLGYMKGATILEKKKYNLK
tara:strand:- start:156 stop:764 length:609 start_codon:yes stop_codon:yes gene_type:complete